MRVQIRARAPSSVKLKFLPGLPGQRLELRFNSAANALEYRYLSPDTAWTAVTGGALDTLIGPYQTNAANSATAAATSASQANGYVGVAGSWAATAQQWATSLTVLTGGQYGALKYANDAAASATTAQGWSNTAGSWAATSQQWATSLTVLTGGQYGALKYANDAAGSATAAAGSATASATSATTSQAWVDVANKWATFMGGEVVVGFGFSAKQYAANAAASAASIDTTSFLNFQAIGAETAIVGSATLDLSTIPTWRAGISGPATITSFGTTAASQRKVHRVRAIDSTVSIVASAAVIVPGVSPLVLDPGDIFDVTTDASTPPVARVQMVSKADGSPISPVKRTTEAVRVTKTYLAGDLITPTDGTNASRPYAGDGATVGGRALAFKDENPARGLIYGLLLSNNVANAATQIDIAPGSARASSNLYDLALASAMTKRLDAVWAVGTGNGGLDTGTVAASTSYHVHLIRRDSDGLVDALFSTSATSPVLPTGWSNRRRIGAIVTNSSSQIRGFRQIDDWFHYKTNTNAIADIVDQPVGPTAINYTLPSAPKGIKVLADIHTVVKGDPAGSSTGVFFQFLRDPDLGAFVLSDTRNGYAFRLNQVQDPGLRNNSQIVRCWTDANGRVTVADTETANALISIAIQGYMDTRDKFL
jgi:hypothetical protein